jgi:phosphate acetyltransferase
MILGNKRTAGKKWGELGVGERVEVTRTVADRDILLHLGVIDDTNPMYLHSHDAEYGQLAVPPGLLVGWLTSLVSTRLPGPGSVIREQRLRFPRLSPHGATVTLSLELTEKHPEKKMVTVQAMVRDEDGRPVVEGELLVSPPRPTPSLLHHALDNF